MLHAPLPSAMQVRKLTLQLLLPVVHNPQVYFHKLGWEGEGEGVVSSVIKLFENCEELKNPAHGRFWNLYRYADNDINTKNVYISGYKLREWPNSLGLIGSKLGKSGEMSENVL